MSGDSRVKENFDSSTANIVKVKYALVTSSDVGRKFSQYKSVLKDSSR